MVFIPQHHCHRMPGSDQYPPFPFGFQYWFQWCEWLVLFVWGSLGSWICIFNVSHHIWTLFSDSFSPPPRALSQSGWYLLIYFLFIPGSPLPAIQPPIEFLISDIVFFSSQTSLFLFHSFNFFLLWPLFFFIHQEAVFLHLSKQSLNSCLDPVWKSQHPVILGLASVDCLLPPEWACCSSPLFLVWLGTVFWAWGCYAVGIWVWLYLPRERWCLCNGT